MDADSLRLSFFIGALVLFSALEALWPKRKRAFPRHKRWATNIVMSAVSSVLIKLMGPVVAVISAGWAADKGWGIFNVIDAMPIVEIILAIIMLDLFIYGQHVLSHKIPLLWRLHKVHHTDRDIDASTAIRFHPIEIVLSMLFKIVVVMLLGPAVLAVIIFEIVLNVSALFNHANLKLPKGLDKLLRSLIVTPDMHHIHHSTRPEETHSNFGFCLSVWDRLFKTYTQTPKADMKIGLPIYQSKAPNGLLWSLSLPFRPKT